ncbi:unnamed protein product [Mesocestoides corti]|uniref:Ubiquinone biosynthesis protein COQ4 homolog, mitochondrial n=1 Tax=Mesocestoides corti TaxID=53468 RepID=A0A0R3UC81_MESCO|nr:unnamed protein product [Mesocestoides corti]
MDLLYEGHITTTKLQKALLAVTSGIACMLYPQRPDFIALFGETTGHRALKRLFVKMRSDPEGAAVLANRPRIRSSTIDFGYLRQLPSHTFGSHYVAFLDRYGYSPNDRGLVNFVDDPDLAYVMQRYREVHDLVHVLLGQQTDMLGEVVVKWVEGLQLGLPLGLLGGFFGALRLKPK